jgi:hypothetical protein
MIVLIKEINPEILCGKRFEDVYIAHVLLRYETGGIFCEPGFAFFWYDGNRTTFCFNSVLWLLEDCEDKLVSMGFSHKEAERMSSWVKSVWKYEHTKMTPERFLEKAGWPKEHEKAGIKLLSKFAGRRLKDKEHLQISGVPLFDVKGPYSTDLMFMHVFRDFLLDRYTFYGRFKVTCPICGKKNSTDRQCEHFTARRYGNAFVAVPVFIEFISFTEDV